MSTAPKTRLNSDQRRAAIVDAAVRLFSEHGFRGTTTRELAAAVGVSEPTLYAHFATKRDLYSAIIEQLAHGGMETFLGEMLGPAFAAEDDQAVFSLLAEAFLDWYSRDPSYIRLLLFSALERHELAELCYQQHFVSFLEMMSGYIRRRIDQGVFRPIDPVLAIRAFVGMVSDFGMSAHVYKHPEPYDRKTIIDTVVGIFLNGIRKI
jgi:AcrR family transcriptional regulator